jgi:hypothetical protein
MATTTNYSWTTPDDTALVKDGAAAIRTLGSSIDTTTKNLNPSTTLGDIEYRSSTANTNTRLGIGTSGQVLTVSGGVPAWATAASGGMTLISTTTLSGSSVTLSSIPSTYKNLQLVIRDVATATDDNYVLLRLNGDSGSNRHASVSANAADYTVTFNSNQIVINSGIDNAVFDGLTIVDIPDYANTVTQKIAPYRGLYQFHSSGTKISVNSTIFYNQTSAISSLEINILYGTFSGGTALLYGVS